MVHHSGIGTYIRGIVEGLQELRTSVDSDAPPPLTFVGDPRALATHESFRGGDIVPSGARIYSLAEQFRFPKIPQAGAYHFPHYSVPQLLRPKRPFAVTIHDLIHLLFPEVVGSRAKWLVGRAVLRSAVRRASVILTVSEHTRRDLAKHLHLDESRIIVTPNAVFPGFQPVSPDQLQQFRTARRLPAHYLLAVGIAKPHKNLELLIRAFATWRKKSAAEIALAVCGVDERSVAKFSTLSDSLGAAGAVTFLPYLPHEQMPALYQAAEALVFPSRYEGFGLPVLEAQRVGTPVIASTAASIPEVAGDAALYFDPRSSDELIARLDEFTSGGSDLRTALVTRGYLNEQRFSWTITGRTISKVYHSLIQ